MPLGALIGALGGLGGAGLSSGLSLQAAREQMKFQERMSNTALQRMRADAEAAGINPVFWAAGGRAASTPPGARAEMNFGDLGVSSALAARREKALLNQELRLKKAETWAKQTQSAMFNWQANHLKEMTENAKTTGQLMKSRVPGAMIDAMLDASAGESMRRSTMRWVPFSKWLFGEGGGAPPIPYRR